MSDDFDLLERWRRGDRDAGGQLLERCYPLLHRFFAAKLSEDRDRQDLIQTTLLALTSALDRVAPHTNFSSFVLGVARHKLVDFLRSRSAKPFDPLTHSISDALGPSPTSQIAGLERSASLVAALALLPVDDRIMLELRYWHDMESPAIADVFALTPAAVRSQLDRARDKLARLLTEAPARGVEPVDAETLGARMRELGLAIE